MNWALLIKKFISFGVLFGGPAKKLAGINDFANLMVGVFTFNPTGNIVTFPQPLPVWAKPDRYFRVTDGGGSNNTALFKIKTIDPLTNTVEVFQPVDSFSGLATLDGRIWAIIDNSAIAKASSTGSTIFNVHNRNSTGIPDGSGIALTYAEHYHDEPETEQDQGEIISHLRNEAGGLSMVTDSCTNQLVDVGPLVVIDSEGVVVRARTDNPVNSCYPPEGKCY